MGPFEGGKQVVPVAARVRASRAKPSGPPKRGRRPGDNVTAELLLDVAEGEFAARGFARTSLREISDKAALNPALVRYYFGSKEGLYTEILVRRGRQVARERIRLLDELEQRPGRPPKLEEIIRAFLLPVVAVRRQGPGGMAFVRLTARIQNEPQEVARELRRELYEESTQRFIEAFRRALPNLEPNTIFWRMIAFIGAYLYTMSDANRLETLSKGACRSSDIDEALRQLVPFLTGGMRAPDERAPRVAAGAARLDRRGR
jgi:AcrR family transcriptional regulator